MLIFAWKTEQSWNHDWLFILWKDKQVIYYHDYYYCKLIIIITEYSLPIVHPFFLASTNLSIVKRKYLSPVQKSKNQSPIIPKSKSYTKPTSNVKKKKKTLTGFIITENAQTLQEEGKNKET